jgi:hypothetical protein
MFTPPQLRRPARRPAREPTSRPSGLNRYLTDGIELYRLLGALTDGACALVGVENCRSLQIMLIPVSELSARFRAVLPSGVGQPPDPGHDVRVNLPARSTLPAARVCPIVMDGWGIAPPGPGNAIELAATPVFDRLRRDYPHTALTASGPSVGLPDGQMGNSEVGHLTLGAGSTVPQTLTLIDHQVATGELAHNAVIRQAPARSPRHSPTP